MSKTNRDSTTTSNTSESAIDAPASFETALAELETMVANMEAGELTLEQSLAAYKRGAALLQYCQSALKDAQQQVKVLEAGMLHDLPDADDNG
jgi:exodeoxyribonuclease VII small subunit